MTILDGCQGKPRTPTLEEKICPNCGSIIEIFSTDTQVACEKCGFIAYNDSLSCVQWCKYARKCVGDEMYEPGLIVRLCVKKCNFHTSSLLRCLVPISYRKTAKNAIPAFAFSMCDLIWLIHGLGLVNGKKLCYNQAKKEAMSFVE